MRGSDREKNDRFDEKTIISEDDGNGFFRSESFDPCFAILGATFTCLFGTDSVPQSRAAYLTRLDATRLVSESCDGSARLEKKIPLGVCFDKKNECEAFPLQTWADLL